MASSSAGAEVPMRGSLNLDVAVDKAACSSGTAPLSPHRLVMGSVGRAGVCTCTSVPLLAGIFDPTLSFASLQQIAATILGDQYLCQHTHGGMVYC